MDAVAALGCVVCRRALGCYSPAEIHHTQGKTKPGAHMLVLGLCPQHHRLGCRGVALHAGRRVWERLYGTQAELLAWTDEQLRKAT